MPWPRSRRRPSGVWKPPPGIGARFAPAAEKAANGPGTVRIRRRSPQPACAGEEALPRPRRPGRPETRSRRTATARGPDEPAPGRRRTERPRTSRSRAGETSARPSIKAKASSREPSGDCDRSVSNSWLCVSRSRSAAVYRADGGPSPRRASRSSHHRRAESRGARTRDIGEPDTEVESDRADAETRGDLPTVPAPRAESPVRHRSCRGLPRCRSRLRPGSGGSARPAAAGPGSSAPPRRHGGRGTSR